MAKYFRRDKYQINMLSKEIFKKWIEMNPQFKKRIDYAKFRRYWKYFRDSFYEEVLSNPDGIDLPLFMGNISIKILDIDFKCADDYLTTVRTNEKGEKYHAKIPSSDTPKKGKIVWKKNRQFTKVASYLGMESAKSFRRTVGSSIKNRTHFYQKMANKDKVPSKCTEKKDLKKFSIFDLL